jgi:hypothetical protein
VVNCTLLLRRSMAVLLEPWLSRELANGRPEQVGRVRACGEGQGQSTRGLDIKGSEREDSNHVPGPRRA